MLVSNIFKHLRFQELHTTLVERFLFWNEHLCFHHKSVSLELHWNIMVRARLRFILMVMTLLATLAAIMAYCVVSCFGFWFCFDESKERQASHVRGKDLFLYEGWCICVGGKGPWVKMCTHLKHTRMCKEFSIWSVTWVRTYNLYSSTGYIRVITHLTFY